MGNRVWNCWVIGSILAAALWAGGSAKAGSKAAEKGQPDAFNSAMSFGVFAVVGEKHLLVGRTPSEQPVSIPPCRWWYVKPLRPVDMEKVRQEMEAQRIPGLELDDITDADLEHLKGMPWLQYLEFSSTEITGAGLDNLKGLTGLTCLKLWDPKLTDTDMERLGALTSLRELDIGGTSLTDGGLAHLEGLTGLQGLDLGGTQVTDAGLAHLEA